jgi:hypothetical protein
MEEQKPKEQINMQYVFVTLANGKRGVFAGPELISKAELTLCPPRIVDIIFSEPKAPEVKSEEAPKS